VALDGVPLEGCDLVAELGALTLAYGVGRGIHVGETALGIKGRIGFEAGAAIVLIAAHRELEKLVLTKWQSFWKDQLARFYGDRLHEGQALDPALRDVEAFFASTQRKVAGDTRVRLAPGRFQVVGARSPHALFDPEVAVYGEENRLWSGDDARAFSRIAAIPSLLASRGDGRS
jgi:argininosuccinate synthase